MMYLGLRVEDRKQVPSPFLSLLSTKESVVRVVVYKVEMRSCPRAPLFLSASFLQKRTQIAVKFNVSQAGAHSET